MLSLVRMLFPVRVLSLLRVLLLVRVLSLLRRCLFGRAEWRVPRDDTRRSARPNFDAAASVASDGESGP